MAKNLSFLSLSLSLSLIHTPLCQTLLHTRVYRKTKTMKQKVVIKVAMKEQNSRSKALKIVGCVPGLQSVAFAGQNNNHIVLIGDGIDAVALTTLLRRKVGSSELVSVGPVDYGGDGTMQIPVGGYYPYNPYAPLLGHGYETNQNPYAYGQIQGYETMSQNPYAYGQGYGYETINQNHYDYRPGHDQYATGNQNPDSCCSIM